MAPPTTTSHRGRRRRGRPPGSGRRPQPLVLSAPPCSVRPSDPRLLLPLKDFSPKLFKKRASRAIGACSLLDLAAAPPAAVCTSGWASLGSVSDLPYAADSSRPLFDSYDPASPWGVSSIRYDPSALPWSPLPSGRVMSPSSLEPICRLPPIRQPRPAIAIPTPTLMGMADSQSPTERRIGDPKGMDTVCMPSLLDAIEAAQAMARLPASSSGMLSPGRAGSPSNTYLMDKTFVVMEANGCPAVANDLVSPPRTNGSARRRVSKVTKVPKAPKRTKSTPKPRLDVAAVPAPPPADRSMLRPSCSCITNVPDALLTMLDQTSDVFGPRMIEQYVSFVDQLCAEHRAKYNYIQAGTQLRPAVLASSGPVHPKTNPGSSVATPTRRSAHTPALSLAHTPAPTTKATLMATPAFIPVTIPPSTVGMSPHLKSQGYQSVPASERLVFIQERPPGPAAPSPSVQPSLPAAEQQAKKRKMNGAVTRTAEAAEAAAASDANNLAKSTRDGHYRQRVLEEIQVRFSRRLPSVMETHGDVTNEVVRNLLVVAHEPNVCPEQGPVDLYRISSDEAGEMLDSGSPDVPIVTLADQTFRWKRADGAIEELFLRMENLERDVSVQVPSRDCTTDSFESRGLAEVRDRFLRRRASADGDGYGDEDDPWNILDLRSPLPAAVLPRFLTGENCQLLPRLRDEVLNPSRAERDRATREQWNEWRDVLEWVLLSQGGHHTSPHTDSHGLGTWITVQQGLFGFGWLSRPTAAERAAWMADPSGFTGGRWCYMVLEPGQTVFFNSGTVHFVFRRRNAQTLALGGHVLQWTGIERWVRTVAAQMRNPHITNEDMEWSAPKYVRVVARLVEARLRRGRVDELGGAAAVRRLLDLLKEFDETYIKPKPKPRPKAKRKKRRQHR